MKSAKSNLKVQTMKLGGPPKKRTMLSKKGSIPTMPVSPFRSISKLANVPDDTRSITE